MTNGAKVLTALEAEAMERAGATYRMYGDKFRVASEYFSEVRMVISALYLTDAITDDEYEEAHKQANEKWGEIISDKWTSKQDAIAAAEKKKEGAA